MLLNMLFCYQYKYMSYDPSEVTRVYHTLSLVSHIVNKCFWLWNRTAEEKKDEYMNSQSGENTC